MNISTRKPGIAESDKAGMRAQYEQDRAFYRRLFRKTYIGNLRIAALAVPVMGFVVLHFMVPAHAAGVLLQAALANPLFAGAAYVLFNAGMVYLQTITEVGPAPTLQGTENCQAMLRLLDDIEQQEQLARTAVRST